MIFIYILMYMLLEMRPLAKLCKALILYIKNMWLLKNFKWKNCYNIILKKMIFIEKQQIWPKLTLLILLNSMVILPQRSQFIWFLKNVTKLWINICKNTSSAIIICHNQRLPAFFYKLLKVCLCFMIKSIRLYIERSLIIL